MDHKRGLNALLAGARSKGAEAEGANHLEGKGGKVWHGLLINCSRKTKQPFLCFLKKKKKASKNVCVLFCLLAAVKEVFRSSP